MKWLLIRKLGIPVVKWILIKIGEQHPALKKLNDELISGLDELKTIS
jgi:hypothetical protein